MSDFTVYHVLDEAEKFSEFEGGAISRWVANIVRFDETSKVLCPDADDTWRISPERIIRSPMLAGYKTFQRRTRHKLPWPFRRPLLQWILKRGLKEVRENDVVWVHNRPDFAVALQPFIRARKARLALHMHNSFLVQWKGYIMKALAVDMNVFVSEFLKNEAHTKWPHLRQCVVLYNGADDKMFFPLNGRKQKETRTILFASRLVPEKGVHIFLQAMRLLQERKTPAQGVVVGASAFGGSKPTPYIGELHKSAPSNVVFDGYVAGKNLALKFREADVFCCASTWNEPFGLVNIEAMACAVPVVATRTGGIPEIFREGGGLLVEPGSAEQLADAIEKLAFDPALREQMGAQGLASFQKNFTWSVVRHNYENLLGKLVQ
jgi:spore coat protein SA